MAQGLGVWGTELRSLGLKVYDGEVWLQVRLRQSVEGAVE